MSTLIIINPIIKASPNVTVCCLSKIQYEKFEERFKSMTRIASCTFLLGLFAQEVSGKNMQEEEWYDLEYNESSNLMIPLIERRSGSKIPHPLPYGASGVKSTLTLVLQSLRLFDTIFWPDSRKDLRNAHVLTLKTYQGKNMTNSKNTLKNKVLNRLT